MTPSSAQDDWNRSSVQYSFISAMENKITQYVHLHALFLPVLHDGQPIKDST